MRITGMISVAACALAIAACGKATVTAQDVDEDGTTSGYDNIPDHASDVEGSESGSVEGMEYVVIVDSDGLGIVPLGDLEVTLLPFGTSSDDVQDALLGVLGTAPNIHSNDECGAGPMVFADFGALTINYQNDTFVGWSLDEAADIATPSGLSIGSARSETEGTKGFDLYEESTLGEEFTIEDQEGQLISGLFGADGVENLWAGANCNFR